MKKYNLLLCLFITIFSCNQNTNQINPIKSPSSSSSIISNINKTYISPNPSTITTSSPIPSPSSNEILLKNPDYSNIDLKDFRADIYLMQNKNIFDSIKSYTTYSILSDETIYLKPEIHMYKGNTYIEDNNIKNFSFINTSNQITIDKNGLIKIKNVGFYEIQVIHNPSGFNETFRINISNPPENKSMRDFAKEFYFNNISGKVYDVNNNLLKDIFVKIYIDDKGFELWKGEDYSKEDGTYSINYVPYYSRSIMIATKKGYTTRIYTGILSRTDFSGSPNFYNFENIYSLQKEPEINYLEINGKRINGSSNGDVFSTYLNNPKYIKPTIKELSTIEQIKGVGNISVFNSIENKNLEVKMCFSEEVDKKSVEDNFRIQSQNNINLILKSYIIDKNNSNLNFEWYKKNYFENQQYLKKLPDYIEEIPCVKISSNEPLFTNFKGEETRYLIDFQAPFQDLEGNKAIERRYFRFSPSQINDFAVFSVQNNNNLNPLIEKIEAINSDNSNDIIKIFYNKSLKKYLKDSLPLLLKSSNIYKDDNYSRDYNINKDKNNSTILGYLDNGTFYAVYMIGKIEVNDIDKSNQIKSLGTNENFDIEPKKVYANPIIKNVSVDDEVITLEFDSKAFSKDDAIILSLGKNINGRYVKNNEKQNQILTVFDWERINYYKFIDFSLPQFSMENHEVKTNTIITSDPLQVSTFAKDN